MLSEPLSELVPPESATRRTVLIVDNDSAMANGLSVCLSRQGFATLTADSAQLAVALARAEQPHCIVLDTQLADADGFELCQQLVDDDQTGEIPVIIVSGFQQSDVVRRSRAAGCHFFLHKPFDPNALLTLIQQAIDDALSS